MSTAEAAAGLRNRFAPHVASVAGSVRADQAVPQGRRDLVDTYPLETPVIELSDEGLKLLRDSRRPTRGVFHLDDHGPMVPVGEYGKEFADFLLNVIFCTQEWRLYPEQIASEPLGAFDVMLAHALTGSPYLDGPPEGPLTALPTGETVRVGVQSAVEAFAQFTAYKVPGYADPLKLVDAVARSGAVETLAGLLPLAVLGPMSLAGIFFPPPLILPISGSVEIAPAFRKFLEREKQVYLEDVKAIRDGRTPQVQRKAFNLLPLPAAGAGCPMSRSDDDQRVPLSELVLSVSDWMNQRRQLMTGPRGVDSPRNAGLA